MNTDLRYNAQSISRRWAQHAKRRRQRALVVGMVKAWVCSSTNDVSQELVGFRLFSLHSLTTLRYNRSTLRYNRSLTTLRYNRSTLSLVLKVSMPADLLSKISSFPARLHSPHCNRPTLPPHQAVLLKVSLPQLLPGQAPPSKL